LIRLASSSSASVSVAVETISTAGRHRDHARDAHDVAGWARIGGEALAHALGLADIEHVAAAFSMR
jgi:hypothetical protein